MLLDSHSDVDRALTPPMADSPSLPADALDSSLLRTASNTPSVSSSSASSTSTSPTTTHSTLLAVDRDTSASDACYAGQYDGTNLIVNYIPVELSHEAMRRLFRQHGNIERCKIVRCKITGQRSENEGQRRMNTAMLSFSSCADFLFPLSCCWWWCRHEPRLRFREV